MASKHLLRGEAILAQTRVHFIHFLRPLLGMVAALLVAAAAVCVAQDPTVGIAIQSHSLYTLLVAAAIFGGPILALICLLTLPGALLELLTTSATVTSRRVIVHSGFFWRRLLELPYHQVEGISIEQSLLGRLLDYGTVTISGTGGSQEVYPDVCSPHELRMQALQQIEAALRPAPAPQVWSSAIPVGAPRRSVNKN